MNNYEYFDEIDFIPLVNNNNYNNMVPTFGPYEGFTKGNLFKNLYSQYRNYKPQVLTPNSEKEEALLNLDQIGFAMHELNLYLDVHPNDSRMMEQFKVLRDTYNNLLDDYEKRFGAICINSKYLNNVPFEWSSSSFPWDWRDM